LIWSQEIAAGLEYSFENKLRSCDMKHCDIKRRVLAMTTVCVIVGVAGMAHAAGDIGAGKAKASACMGCHGTAGLGNAENPPLAGKDAKQLVQQMRDYKSGARQHLLMNQMMKPLSEQDIENLAAYYASLKAK
jgi:cytochrome c553